jgi:rhodanese-related sulfurtransferase
MIRSPRCWAHSLTIALWLAALVSCSPGAANTSISQAELADRIGTRSAPLIIDVRTRSEFNSGHIPGAVNIPHTELPSRLGELEIEGDQEIVVYCEQGGRAMTAASALRGAGFSTVLHLEGDMSAWRGTQLPCAGC